MQHFRTRTQAYPAILHLSQGCRCGACHAFVLPLLIIPFEMIDDIVFHHEGFQETGMMAALVLTAIELVIFCYCALAPRFGMRGKQWKEMQHRLVVEQTEKDRSAQIAGVIGTQPPRACSRTATTRPRATWVARQKSPLP